MKKWVCGMYTCEEQKNVAGERALCENILRLKRTDVKKDIGPYLFS